MTIYRLKTTVATNRVNNTAYAIGDRVVLARADTQTNYLNMRPYVYECTTAGTSGATVPVYNYTPGSTTTDGSVVWTCRAPTTWADAQKYPDYINNTILVNGDKLYYSSTNFSVSVAATVTLNTVVTVSSYDVVYHLSVNETTEALEKGAIITSTGTGGISLFTGVYANGFTFNVGTGSSSGPGFYMWATNASTCILENSDIVNVATNSDCHINIGSSAGSSLRQSFLLRNVTWKTTSATQKIRFNRGLVAFENFSIASGSATTTTGLMTTGDLSATSQILLKGCNIVNCGGDLLAAPVQADIRVIDLTVASGKGIYTGDFTTHGCQVEAFNIDSGDTNYQYIAKELTGTTVTDTGIYLTTGAATTKRNGSDVSYSLKASPNASMVASNVMPLITKPLAVFNDTPGALTVSLKVAYDNVTALKNNQLFIRVLSQNTTGSNAGTFTQPVTMNDILNGAGTSLTDTSESWNGTGGWANKKTHTLTVNVTTAEQGVVYVQLVLLAVGYNVYFNPIPVIA